MWYGIGALLVVLIYVIIAYNGLITLKNRVEEGYATMDVYLKQRSDLIPNLVSSVKGYAAHEQSTLEMVITARNKAMASNSIDDRASNENSLSNHLKSLFALGESYPDLKADSQFLSLQDKLTIVEGDIAKSRKYYNAVAKELNTRIEMFPTNIIASTFGFRGAQYFNVDIASKEPVKVEF